MTGNRSARLETDGYSLDLGCPSKAHVLKAWFPVCGTIGRWWKLWEVGPGGRKLGHWGCAFEGGIVNPSPSCSFLFASPLQWGEQDSSAVCSCHDVLCCHSPKVTGPSDHGLKPLKLWAKINLSSQVFCHSNRKSTNTLIKLTPNN
jgi:hypothetical protein